MLPSDAEILDTVALADQTGQWDGLVTLGDALLGATGTLSPPVAYAYARALMERREYGRAWPYARAAARALTRRGPPAFRVPAALSAGAAAFRVGRSDAGLTWWWAALGFQPTDPHQRVSQGHVRLALGGAWGQGWRDTLAKDHLPDRHFPPELRRWHGGPTDAPVWVLHEQGLGDTVLMLRFVPLLAAQSGHRPVVVMPAPLVRWAERAVGEVADIFDGTGVTNFPPEARWGAWTMDLPLCCTSGPIGPWQAKRPPVQAPPGPVRRVGVCWRGSSGGHANMERSTEAVTFRPLADIPGVKLVNLTLGADDADGLGLPVLTPADVPDVAATADLLATCDVVVSVDTMVAHLAGTLGLPTHVLPPTVPDWRWGRGSRTPWYPTVTVHRRPAAHDWPAAVASVTRALAAP